MGEFYNPLYNKVKKYIWKNLEARARSYYENDVNYVNNKHSYAYIESLCDKDTNNPNKVLARMGKVRDYQGGYGATAIVPNPNKIEEIDHTMYRTSDRQDNLELESAARFFSDGIRDDAKKNIIKQNGLYGRGGYPLVPILKSISITNEGEMGSLQKANVSFTIPDPTLFDIYEELFMRPGRELQIKYGWNTSASGHNTDPKEYKCSDSDIFRGIVYNTSWNVNSNLGYDCTVDVVGEGFFSINGAATAPFEGGDKYGDPKGLENKILDLASQINGDMNTFENSNESGDFLLGKEILKNVDISGYKKWDHPNKLVYYRKKIKTSEVDTVEENYIKNNERTRVTSLADIKIKNPMSQTNYYLSLNQLIKYFNSKVLSNFKDAGFEIKVQKDGEINHVKGKYKIIKFSADLEEQLSVSDPFTTKKTDLLCNEKENVKLEDSTDFSYSAGLFVRYLKSANPKDIILPGERNGNYWGGDNTFYPKQKKLDGVKLEGGFLSRYDHNSTKNEYGKKGSCRLVNLGEILISTDLILSLYEKSQEKQDEPINTTISNFFKLIFNEISLQTGKVHQLTLMSREYYDESDTETVIIENTIIDTNFSGCGNVKPLVFTPRVHKAIMRDLSISSKLPNATQTAMYAGGRSKISGGSTNSDNFSSLQKRYFEGCGTDPNGTGADPNQEEITQKQIINNEGVTVDEKGNESIADWLRRLEAICKAIMDNGINSLYVNELRAIMLHLKITPTDFEKPNEQDSVNKVAGSWVNRTIYPVDLTITLDGISGFRFGNVVSCDWLPQKYRYDTEDEDNKVKVVFVVTKVEHKIEGSDWSTTLQTQCRLEGGVEFEQK